MKSGRPPTRLVALVCCIALLSVAAGTIAAGADTGTTQPSIVDTDGSTSAVDTEATADLAADSLFATQDEVDTDRIRIDIALQTDGSASWTIEFWSVLDDDDSTAAFDSLADDIASDPDSYTADFSDRIDDTVDTASQSTNREMSADAFSVETDRQSLGREYGIVRYTFEWTGFAQVDGETLRAGDAIDGLFLDDGSRLLVSWPDDYELQSVTPEPDDERANAVIWRGDSTEFLSGEPRLAVGPATLGVGSGTLAVSLVALALLLGGVGWLLRRRSTDGTDGTDEATDSIAATGSTAESTEPASEADASPAPEQPVDSSPGSEPDSEPTSDPAAGSHAEPDSELLSNEEQVLQLLESNGGRMKQQTVVQELGWTDAKTSKVVSKLRDDEEIESFRIGRENVLRVLDEDSEGTSL